MLRTFRYPLHPTVEQEVARDGWLARACSLYNGALEERREAWRKQRHSVTRYDQQKSLTLIRAEDPEYEAVPVVALRSPIYRVDRAMQAFFRRAKSGKKPGFPRFRSRLSVALSMPNRDAALGSSVRVVGIVIMRTSTRRRF